MPFTIERGDDPYLDELWDQAEQRGEKRGQQKGKLEGKLEGKTEGLLLGKIDFMRKSLELRFGPLPGWANERLSSATNELLDLWLTRVYTANSIEEVLH